jgi:hypothetical protein
MRSAAVLACCVVVAAGCGGGPKSATNVVTTKTPSGLVVHRVQGQQFLISLPRSWRTLDAQAALKDPSIEKIAAENPSLAQNLRALRNPSSPLKLVAVRGDDVTVAVSVFPALGVRIGQVRAFLTQKLRSTRAVENDSIVVRQVQVNAGRALEAVYDAKVTVHGDQELRRAVLFLIPARGKLFEVAFGLLSSTWPVWRGVINASGRSFDLTS